MMSDIHRLEPRDMNLRSEPAQAHQSGCQVVDISRRDCFNLQAIPAIARDFARLPARRDREAAITKLIRDFRRKAKERHGVGGRPLDGAAIAVESRLRREIREIVERREE